MSTPRATESRKMPDAPTAWELNRNILALRDELREARRDLQALHTLEVEHARVKERVDENSKRLDDLEEAQTWLVRLVIGAVIAAALAIVLADPSLAAEVEAWVP